MRIPMIAAGVIGGLLFMASGDAFGHGGTYRGPGDTVPPGSGDGPGTGGGGSGPVTGNPGGPNTPGPGGGPVTPGGGVGGPGGGSGGTRGPTTGGGRGSKKNAGGEGFEQWQFWWENNKDRYLDLRSRLGTGVVQSGSTGFLTGMGRKEAASTSKRPTSEEVNQNIVPVLKTMLLDDDADVVDSSVLALARIVRTDSAALVFEDIKRTLSNNNPTVKQAAVLSLGVLGSKEGIPLLIQIMHDTPEGRKLLDERNKIQNLPRAFAAIALGYIGAPETIEVLTEVIVKNANTEIDLRSAAILSLGLFDEGREEIVQFLVGLMKDTKMDRTTRAQIPVTLARLGEVAQPALPELLKEARAKKTDIRMQESCIIALGQLGRPEDDTVLEALYGLVEEGSNPQARHFALISLAQIGGQAAKDRDANGALLSKMNKFLLKELTKPKKKTHSPWAAISLALLGREYPDTAADRVTLTTKIMEEFDSSNNPSHKAGMAIALGLLNATSAAPSIYKELLDTHDSNLKGYLAVSLGMMRFTDALDTLRRLVLENKDPKMRLQVATSLGLMGDVEAVPLLLTALKEARTLGVISSMAKALGLIGDKNALPDLYALAQDSAAPGLARAFSCVAIGLIGEKTDLPWNCPLSEHTNYRTVVPALYEVLDIL